LLRERIEEVNASVGKSPQFVIRGSSVQLGNAMLQLEFLSSVQSGWPDQGKSTSAKLVEIALDLLTAYADKHHLT
jgi:hypothetical protein